MIEHLKSARTAAERHDDDLKVRQTVADILADIEARGDLAVRELSQRFDKYSPPSFLLSESEIEALMSRVSTNDMRDIRFAHDQVRNFAQIQRDSHERCRG